jgi:thioredoxin 1
MKRGYYKFSMVVMVLLVAVLAPFAVNAANKKEVKKLPRLLELGSTKCVPCKMMAPIIEEIKNEYKGQLVVQFIDVWSDEKAAKKYKVKSIPTQVFFDTKGKEFFRHVGYITKEDILKVFEQHGIKLKKAADSKKPDKK